MDLQSIYGLMERFENSSLSSLELEQDGMRLKLERGTPVAYVSAGAPAPVPVAPLPSQASPSTSVGASGSEPEGEEYIRAPLVGTFYAAASPDSAPFVQVGDAVSKGQTVCILEAMKMMSEIPAPMDCIITEVLAKNGELISFDTPLFRVRRG